MPLTPWPSSIALLSILCLSACSSDGGAECQADADCPPGRYCQNGACGFDCTLDTECESGYRCTIRGRCESGCVETNAGVEACDGQDNDCDGSTDEDYIDLGLPCQNGGCSAGRWICAGDARSLACDGPQPADDDSSCDGIDDDCDDLTDEDAGGQDCPLQQGICAGAQRSCTAGQWTDCDYGLEHTPDVDDTCDKLDNDCDGLTDEDMVPELVGEFGTAALDGLDNNCNGLIDEPGGAMIKIDDSYAIDAFEITVYETSGCTGELYGVEGDDYPAGFPVEGSYGVALFACSQRGAIPSGYLSWYRAQQACQAQGKRLCTTSEFRRACAGPELQTYPYGNIYAATACNDAWAGDSALAPTGSYPNCESPTGVFDMAANQAEWIADWSNDFPDCAGMIAGYYHCIICLGGGPDAGLCWQCDTSDPMDSHKNDLMNDCAPDLTRPYEVALRNEALAHYGARCCMDLE